MYCLFTCSPVKDNSNASSTERLSEDEIIGQVGIRH
jgi:hypothetical protein